MHDAERFARAIRDGIDPPPGLSPAPETPRVRYHRPPHAPRSYLRRKWRGDFIGRLPHGGAWTRREPFDVALSETYYTPVWTLP